MGDGHQQPDLSLGDRATRGAGSGATGHDGLPEGCVVAGRYTLGPVLGRGGMGVVHRAQDSRPRRPVALKFLAAQGQAESAAAARFLAEAETIARLAHLNILQVYDVGEWVHEGRTHRYIAMELVEGGSLRDHLRERGKLAVPEACGLMRQVGQALAYAHRQGVIHRDLKPANVLLTKGGVPKLADFGLAKGLSESELSVSGFGLGTVGFMSPEQRRDAKSVDHRTDIYAWGATLYQVVTGRDPLAWDPDELPAEVSAVVRKCLKDREGRYFSMEEALGALEEAQGAPAAARRTAPGKGPAAAGVCPQCDYRNAPDARFCQGCGAGLYAKCPACGKETRAGVKFCASCGVDVEKHAKFVDHVARGKKHAAEHETGAADTELGFALALYPNDADVSKLRVEVQRRPARPWDSPMEAAREERDGMRGMPGPSIGFQLAYERVFPVILAFVLAAVAAVLVLAVWAMI